MYVIYAMYIIYVMYEMLLENRNDRNELIRQSKILHLRISLFESLIGAYCIPYSEN